MNKNTRFNEGPPEEGANWGMVPCDKFTPQASITKGQCLVRQEEWAEKGDKDCRRCELWVGGDL